jgi:8-hydroxy-5-deazaflavin:NADPH oxidoreductase
MADKIHRRTVLATLGGTIAVGASATGHTQSANNARSREKIAVLGTGSLGQVLAKGWARAGHRIVYGSRTPDDERVRKVVTDTSYEASAATPGEAAGQSDIVVFALPWKAARDLMPAIGTLAGKVIVDPMNSVKLVDGYPLPGETTTSVGEELQSLAPNALVVKAFNTPAARNIVDPKRAGGRVSIPLAGTDAGAKARVAALVSDLGLEPVDTGPLIASRYLEAMMRLSFGYLLYSKGKSFEFYLAPVAR